MTTKPEVDVYVQEQWKLLRIPGDWRLTAEQFFAWGERQAWKLGKPWQSIVDTFIAKAKVHATARAAGAVKKHECHTLVVCALCWRIHDAHNKERVDGQKLAECGCADRCKASQELWRVLKACQSFVTLSFEVAAPPALQVQEKIWRARQRVTVEHADEYARHTSAWFEAMGAPAAPEAVEEYQPAGEALLEGVA